jgi:hypothetical protein
MTRGQRAYFEMALVARRNLVTISAGSRGKIRNLQKEGGGGRREEAQERQGAGGHTKATLSDAAGKLRAPR